MQIYKKERRLYRIADFISFIETNNIDLEPSYQRNFIWSDEKISMYINSTYLDIAYFPITLTKVGNKYICIDGKQRITALTRFISNKNYFEMNNEKIYYDKILDNKVKPIRVMTDEEKNNFNDVNIEVIILNNLSYLHQLDIFHRIQLGVPLTTGEQKIMKLFTDENNAIMFKSFCNLHKDLFNTYDVNRDGHIIIISNIMYIIGADRLQDITKLVNIPFFDDITNKVLEKTIKNTSKIISILYDDDLLNSKKIKSTISKNIIFALVKFVSDMIKESKSININKNKLLDIIINMDKKNNSTTQEALRKIYDDIKNKYDDNNEILEEINDDNKKGIKKKKSSISKIKKSEVWRKWIGIKEGLSICQCCKGIEIEKDNFDCGHIIPESKGGTLDISNLRPICCRCNNSMHDTNMIEFMKINCYNELPKSKEDAKAIYKKYVKSKCESSDDE